MFCRSVKVSLKGAIIMAKTAMDFVYVVPETIRSAGDSGFAFQAAKVAAMGHCLKMQM